MIDLYFAHRPDDATPLDETFAAFDSLVQAGKVRVIGVSNFDAGQLGAALDLTGVPRVEVLQPEFNLRGRMRADAQGRLTFRTIKPRGYFLPEDGPVGRLLNRLGLRLERPAHVHFKVTAPGFRTLVTHVFDRDDPAIDRDALFGVRPDLLAEFRTLPPGGPARHALELTLVLVRDGQANATPMKP